MDFSIVTEYPLWFLVVCILAGIAYAAILYYRELKNEFTDSLKWTLAVLRSVTVALISFLLLNPMIKTSAHHAEKPIIVFAQDNSMSLVTGRDSAFYRQDYPSTVNSLLDRISASCRLDRYTFGEKPDKSFNLDFSEKLTDISGLFQAINDRYAGQNVGALILATDGIYNKGINPLYAVDKFKFPVYTVALGDTNVNRDVILFKVNYNRIAYLDNEFPLEVIIKADKLMNFTTELTISREDTVLFSKLINITSENFFETVNLHLKANESGLQRYSLRLRGAKDEVSTENNFQDIFIDILEDRQKILILAQSPHPDISAIKQAFASNKNYTIENYLIDEFDKEVKGYNLIIFHNLPSAANNLSDFTELILRDRIPVLYIIGKQTNLSYLNWQNTGFQLREDQVLINEAAP
ncbi:MAG: hypothetical protein FJY07_12755, partial [Bacteroidetes bacterium]|nr:hypothetical protein [Bacteroidota bacterium]